MGDSFTEGYYPEDSFAHVLQSTLNALHRGATYEVINCGTTSYSPLLHLLRYKHQLRELQPDEVIVNIDLTDVFDDNWRYRADALFSETGDPLSAGPERFSARMFADELRFRYYTPRLLFGRPGDQVTLPMAENVFAYHRGLATDSEKWQQDVGFTLDLIRRLVSEIEGSGARVTLSMYPYREQLESVDEGPVWNRAFEARVAALADDLDVAFFSAFENIERLFRQGQRLYWNDDFHFDPAGQRAWSDAFARYYVNRLATEQ
jgi:lysophospholipase L1-like esterase